jgi:hypothetical protein
MTKSSCSRVWCVSPRETTSGPVNRAGLGFIKVGEEVVLELDTLNQFL